VREGELTMRGRVNIPILLLIWIIIGILVAVNKGYDNNLDTADGVGTFVLAVMLWPIPATGGGVLLNFN
jgi:hypothetical protein